MTENEEVRRAAESNEAITARDLLAPYILTRDGVPIGRELMNQPEIRIYIAHQAENYDRIPAELRDDVPNMWSWRDDSFISDIPVSQERMQAIMSHAVRYWYTGRIVFTDDPSEANIYVASFDEPGRNIVSGEVVPVAADGRNLAGEELRIGFDNPYPNKALVMLSADMLRQETRYGGATTFDDVLYTATHEVGHIFGIIHPTDRRIHSAAEESNTDPLVSQRAPDQRLQHDLDLTYIIRGR